MNSSNYNLLIGKLDAFIRRYYSNMLLRGLIYSIALVLIFFLGERARDHSQRQYQHQADAYDSLEETDIPLHNHYSFRCETTYGKAPM